MVTKHRWTLLFRSQSDWADGATINGTHIIIRGSGTGSEAVQLRTKHETPTGKNYNLRMTWKHDGELSPLQKHLTPQLLDGFNVYYSPKDKEKLDSLGKEYISTVIQSQFHSSEPEWEKIEELFCGDDGTCVIDFKKLRWSACDYDISLNEDEVQIDTYCPLQKGEELVIPSPDEDIDNLEVGLFVKEYSESFNVELNGARCKWKEDGSKEVDSCEKTLLFYKIHHVWNDESSDKIGISLVEPVGLHPTVEIDMRNYKPFWANSGKSCASYLMMHLPKQLIVDKFQGVPPELLFGETDLELPVYKIDGWGSTVLYSLKAGEINTFKLHSRYLEPFQGGKAQTFAMHPFLFEACDIPNYPNDNNPFYDRRLGMEAYFTNDTVFYHTKDQVLSFEIPVADTNYYQKVQRTTVLCIVLSLLFLLFKIFKRGNVPTSAKK